MKTGFKKKTMIAALTLACVCSLTGGALLSASAAENEPTTSSVQSLNGFECKGVSVNAEEIEMRFEFNLSGDAVSYNDKTAGVVYMPYDLYTGNINDFAKDTDKAATATFAWEDNTLTTDDTTDKVGYTYMNASAIPSAMYNRILLVRGYIEDGDNVYYTEPVKTSMAYSAWKGIGVLDSQYTDALREYMGSYTLTYDGGKIENLYYGDTFKSNLPTQINGCTVTAWYWDKDRDSDSEIGKDDYATGSMDIYYTLESFTLSGEISGADNLDTLKVYEGNTEIPVTVNNGSYRLSLIGGAHTLTFRTEGYYKIETVNLSKETTQDVVLQANTFEISDKVGNMGTRGTYTDDGKGTLTVDTVTVNSWKHHRALFANTFTTEKFTYKVTYAPHVSIDRALQGALISDGTNTLCVGIRPKTKDDGSTVTALAFCYNGAGYMSDAAFTTWYNVEAVTGEVYKNVDATLMFVRTEDSIGIYLADKLCATITKDGLKLENGVTKWKDQEGGGMSAESWSAIQKSFFAENANLCVGILGSGMNTDKTGLKYKLSWYTGEEPASNRFEISDKVGNMETRGTYTDDGNGGITIKLVTAENLGHHRTLFGNTFTTNAFTYEVKYKPQVDVDSLIQGALISNGTDTLCVGIRAGADASQPSYIAFCHSNGGYMTNNYETTWYRIDTVTGPVVKNTDTTVKIERTKDAIKFYVAGKLCGTLTSSGFNPLDGVTFYQNNNNGMANGHWDACSNAFFANNANLCVGLLGSGMTNKDDRLYTCTWFENA